MESLTLAQVLEGAERLIAAPTERSDEYQTFDSLTG